MPIIGRLLGHTQAATTARYAHLDNDPLRRATGRRQALGRQALSELENWPPLLAAECAIVENIDFLEKKMTDLPQPPTAVADVM